MKLLAIFSMDNSISDLETILFNYNELTNCTYIFDRDSNYIYAFI